MKTDKKVLYTITISTLAVLLAALLLPGEYSGRIVAAIALIPLAIVTIIYIKKRSIPSMYKGEVLLLMAVIGAVYLMLYYLSGLAFGYYRNPYFLNFGILLPIVVIIGASELIRFVVRAQESKAAEILCYVSCVLSEVLIVGNIYYVIDFNHFMDFVGKALLPAVISNLLYHYLVKRYGIFPNIAYRAITTLYTYLIPVLPSFPQSLFAFVNLFIPLLIYLFIDALYEKKRRYALKKKSKLAVPLTVLVIALMASLIMLISNQFRFGALVIATESMTGELDKGDVVIFDQEDDQIYTEGQVVVFKSGESTIVHRIVKIERINGANRYFTKGDANESEDAGYITDSNILGSAKARLPYFGYPTLWLRSFVDFLTGK